MKVKVYLHLKTNGHFQREIVIQGDSVRTIVDSGTYSGKKNLQVEESSSGDFHLCQQKKAQRQQTAKATTQYGSDYAAYPSYLKTVLNNRVSKTSYRYVDTKLTLSSTTHTVPTIDAAMNDQSNTTSATNDADDDTTSTSTSDSSSDDSDTGNDASSDRTSSDSDSTDSDSSSSKMTVEKAQAIVEQQYPSADYNITAMGQTGSNFTFVVINQKKRVTTNT